jgi:hypothetical protein
MTRILAFAGRKQSGKDTLGREAFLRLRGAQIYAFASLLKGVCAGVFGVPREQVFGDDATKSALTDVRRIDGSGPLTVRQLLQYLGTEVFRAMKPGCWSAALLRQIAEERPDYAVITDCRFPDEVAAVQKAGGKVIRLTRGMGGDAHESERALDPDRFDWGRFDAVIANTNMNKAEQRAELLTILKHWEWIV